MVVAVFIILFLVAILAFFVLFLRFSGVSILHLNRIYELALIDYDYIKASQENLKVIALSKGMQLSIDESSPKRDDTKGRYARLTQI